MFFVAFRTLFYLQIGMVYINLFLVCTYMSYGNLVTTKLTIFFDLSIAKNLFKNISFTLK